MAETCEREAERSCATVPLETLSVWSHGRPRCIAHLVGDAMQLSAVILPAAHAGFWGIVIVHWWKSDCASHPASSRPRRGCGWFSGGARQHSRLFELLTSRPPIAGHIAGQQRRKLLRPLLRLRQATNPSQQQGSLSLRQKSEAPRPAVGGHVGHLRQQRRRAHVKKTVINSQLS